jgi:SAM-dependent methyltransferase
MTIPQVYSFPRYLAAKKSVDDRALNQHVWQTLCEALAQMAPPEPLRVLEIGAGTGTMVERCLEWGLLERADYTAVDISEENIAAAYARLPLWAQARGYTLSSVSSERAERMGELLLIEGRGQWLRLNLQTSELLDFAARQEGAPGYDLVIAHAFLDLLDLRCALPQVLSLVRPGGWFYFTINFDGATIFQPTIDAALDVKIEQVYHQTMDERISDGQPSGDSQAGRHLFPLLKECGACIAAAGASDWVVHPVEGGYPKDEAYFLHHILYFMESSLRGRPELEAEQLEDWLRQRHAQVEAGELVYIAHQLDFAGRVA